MLPEPDRSKRTDRDPWHPATGRTKSSRTGAAARGPPGAARPGSGEVRRAWPDHRHPRLAGRLNAAGGPRHGQGRSTGRSSVDPGTTYKRHGTQPTLPYVPHPGHPPLRPWRTQRSPRTPAGGCSTGRHLLLAQAGRSPPPRGQQPASLHSPDQPDRAGLRGPAHSIRPPTPVPPAAPALPGR